MLRGKTISGALALIVGAFMGSGTAVADDGGCADAAAMVDATTLGKASNAVLCLVNDTRAARGLAPVRLSRLLDRAAEAHSRDMVARQFFSHVTPGGMDARQRIVRAGYVPRQGAGPLGETIAWGTEDYGTPAELVRTFMSSTGHRRVLLDRRYRDVGVGFVLGAPVAGVGSGATLTLTFGRR